LNLLNGQVDGRELTGTRVRRRAPSTEEPGQRFVVIVGAEHRVKPEPARVVRRRMLLVLRVDHYQQGGDIRHQRAMVASLLPHRRPRLSACRSEPFEDARVDASKVGRAGHQEAAARRLRPFAASDEELAAT
jgi:hypothetical protein